MRGSRRGCVRLRVRTTGWTRVQRCHTKHDRIVPGGGMLDFHGRNMPFCISPFSSFGHLFQCSFTDGFWGSVCLFFMFLWMGFTFLYLLHFQQGSGKCFEHQPTHRLSLQWTPIVFEHAHSLSLIFLYCIWYSRRPIPWGDMVIYYKVGQHYGFSDMMRCQVKQDIRDWWAQQEHWGQCIDLQWLLFLEDIPINFLFVCCVYCTPAQFWWHRLKKCLV